MKSSDIYSYIKHQESQFSQDIVVIDGWAWGMKEHIRRSILYKHGKFALGDNDYSRPNKNIVGPLLNLRYRAEDIDVKDIAIYVNNKDKYHLSFLIKKYHDEVYVKEKQLDVFLDEVKEEKIDFGGVLIRKSSNGPVYESLETIAFCDQTDILTGPIGFKLAYSPEELWAMEKQGWGNEKNGATITIDELIELAEESKDVNADSTIQNNTPGKYIEIYRVHGVLPTSYLVDNENTIKERYTRQIHIVAFYQNKQGEKQGVTLYRAKEFENPFKVHLSGKKIKNRALAYGGIEELFDPQIWTNYSEIRKKEMLDAASKVVFQTTDEAYASRNKIKDLENLEVTVTREGTTISQIPNGSPNIQLFNQWLNEWQSHAQITSAATDALLGKSPTSGTPFALQNLITQQGQGLHDYRRGKYATFIEEIYRDWIIPDIAKKIVNGAKFLATLDVDELTYVANCVARNSTNKMLKDKILNNENIPTPEEIDAFRAQARENFMQNGNKQFIEILKDEFKELIASLSVEVNVAGKQKDLQAVVTKLTNVFREVIKNPQILENPKAAKVFNKLIEYSALDPIDFGYASSNNSQNNMLNKGTPTEALTTPPTQQTTSVIPNVAMA